MALEFHLHKNDGSARAAAVRTAHGEVHTPVFMPVGTQATVKAVPQHWLEEIGVEILLGNTYHLFLRPGVETVRKLGGLHGFMSWERAILTDSGGFQVFSLSELRKVGEEGVTFRSHLDGSAQFLSPEGSIAAQIGLGADIIMAFDECTEYPADEARARKSMELTLRWAERCKRYFEEHQEEVPWTRVAQPGATGIQRDFGNEGDARGGACAPTNQARGGAGAPINHAREGAGAPTNHAREGAGAPKAGAATQSLFAIVQGGMHAKLRKECAERLVEMDFPGYAIGGLSVGEPREVTREIVEATLEHLPKDKPRYLMGVGTPEEIVEYAGLGIDMMDCVLPTRAARHGLLFTSEGKINIKGARYAQDEGPLDPACSCGVCQRYSRAYLRHLYATGEALAQVLNTVHNLTHYLDTMRRVRHSIALGEFASFLSGVRSRSLKSPIPKT